jgi:hypothetical protein
LTAGAWWAEPIRRSGGRIHPDRAMLVSPNGYRVAEMTHARAVGIAAALNTPEGRDAFVRARDEFNASRGGPTD